MPKQLILIRHAKSDWNTPGLADFDRPLNERGYRDAPIMGARLKASGILPDRILSSPARRAQSTAECIAAALDFPCAQIDWRQELYLADTSTMLQIIQQTADNTATLALVAHNPGISMLAAALCGISISMPTCAIVRLECAGDHWYTADNFSFVDFDYPKRKPGNSA